MSIAPPTGAVSKHLAHLVAGRRYMSLREAGRRLTSHLPEKIDRTITRAISHTRTFLTGGTIFEEMGFFYIGPVDGHDLKTLVPILENIRDAGKGPILLHVRTQKGKGYAPAEASADKYHGVVKFDVATGVQAKAQPKAPAYTRVFADALTREAHRLLKASSLNFIGNIEGREIFSGAADVIVCDGFTGNVVLKTSEGLVDAVEALLGDELQGTFSSQVGYLLSRRAFRRFQRRVDYSEYGGAPLLGVAGLAIVGHGRSSAKAVRNAIAIASRFATGDFIHRVEQAIGTTAAFRS